MVINLYFYVELKWIGFSMIKSITILIWSSHVATAIFQLQSMTSDKNHILFKTILTDCVAIYYISMIF